MADSQSKIVLSNNFYDVAKDVTTLWLPALGVLYAGLATFWNFPEPIKVVGTIALICTFLGTVLKISSKAYAKSDASKDGTLIVDQSDPLKDTYLFDVTTDLGVVAEKDTITLKVDNQTPKHSTDSQ